MSSTVSVVSAQQYEWDRVVRLAVVLRNMNYFCLENVSTIYKQPALLRMADAMNVSYIAQFFMLRS